MKVIVRYRRGLNKYEVQFPKGTVRMEEPELRDLIGGESLAEFMDTDQNVFDVKKDQVNYWVFDTGYIVVCPVCERDVLFEDLNNHNCKGI